MHFLKRFKKRYIPLNTISISRDALLHNYRYLSTVDTDMAIAPVLKSNAYGHGIKEVGKILDRVGAPYFCVDSLYEAYELYKAKVKTPILIMGYVNPENLAVKKLPFSYAVSSIETLEAIKKYQPHAMVHLFIDTGMRREGIPVELLHSIIPDLLSNKVRIEGVMSHFAASEEYDVSTKKQVETFQEALLFLHHSGIYPKWIHHGNSSALLNYKSYIGAIGNMARPGIATYGVDPEAKNTSLRPALSFESTLVQIKALAKGEPTGYNFTYIAKKNMKIGVVAAGYNDGIDRRLSNLGFMEIDKIACQIVGRVSMNLTMIDITNVPNPRVGDRVTVFSSDPKAKSYVGNAATISNTIPYDLLVGLTPHTKRIIT